jgi:hypothetical protein
MMNKSDSYAPSPQTSNVSQMPSPHAHESPESQPSSAPLRTRKKREMPSNSKPNLKRGKQRSRRDELLKRLEVSTEELLAQPQITPLLKQNGIKLERIVETLRCDSEEESLAFVTLWDSLTPAMRSLAGAEALAMGAKLTPRRLWELFSGAVLVQSREAIGVMIALAQPDIMRVTIRNAKKAKGHPDREHLFKGTGFLPTPKGSTLTFNVGQQAALPEPADEQPLEPADDLLMRASKAMSPKQLPAEIIDAEDDGDDG